MPAARKVRILPFAHQADILNMLLSKKVKIIVVVSGRGAGKTTSYLYAINAKTSEFLKRDGDFVIWVGTPTMSGTGDKPWRELIRMFGPRGPYSHLKAKIDAQAKMIRCKNVTVRLRPITGRDSGSNEGDAIHFLVLDEAGHKDVTVETFNSMYPAVTRVDGQVFICGTPPKSVLNCNNGWFREKWNLGFNDSDTVASAKWRTFDSPVYGGGMLPYCPTVAELSVMSIQKREEALQLQRECVFNVDDLIKECKSDEKKLESLETIATGTTDDDYKKALISAIKKRLETLEVNIIPQVDKGQPEEAARMYDGEWLPRPATLGEDVLNFVRMSIMRGKRYSFTVDGTEFEKPAGIIEEWIPPEQLGQYVIGLDSAAGGGGDYSVAVVMKRPEDLHERKNDSVDEGMSVPIAPAKIVAMLRTNSMPIDQVAEKVYYLAKKYNNALVVPEITGAYGLMAIYAMRNKAAANNNSIWIWNDSGKPDLISSYGQSVKDTGWKTTPPSKGMMLTVLRKYLHTKTLITPSQAFYDELIGFNWELAGGTETDDVIMATAMAIQGIELCPEGVPLEETFEETYERALMGEKGYEVDTWL